MTGAPRSPLFSLDVLQVLRRIQSAGFCMDLDASAQGDAERRPDGMAVLFERVLCRLSKETPQREKGEIRPFPALLGDGRPVDLFRLYSTVREKGGYKRVTAAGLWGSVAGESGLDAGLGSALKLVYSRYLGVLERCLRQVSARETEGRARPEEVTGSFLGKDDDYDGGLGRVFLDLKAVVGEGIASCSQEHPCTPLKACELEEQLANGGGDYDVAVLDSVTGSSKSPCLRRKRESESLVGVLDWLKKVAKSPGTPIGSTQLDRSKGICHAVGEPLSQALFAREAMYANLFNTSGADVSLSQKKQKVHPSMYDDYPDNYLVNERLRCSQRIISLRKKAQLGSSSETSTFPDSESEKDLIESKYEDINGKRCSRNHSLSYIAGISGKDRKCIIIGPEHQVKIPEWTGRNSATLNDTDTEKFLGTPIWPLKSKDKNPFNKQDPIGRGRQDTCGCDHRGSVECVRFHVAEKRFLLKRELGSAFFGMGFHHMGEEVSLSWTKEEEQKFKAAVHQNPPSVSKSFWDPIFLCFPSKTRQSLVSYYFNVFILQRRSYQNRVTPKEIDSDDDESEFGFLSNAFGRNAVEVQNPKSIVCVQNAQCVSLDDFSDTDNA